MGRGTEEIFFQRIHTDGQQARENILNLTNHQGNVNKKYSEIPPHTSQLLKWLLSKKTRNNKSWWGCGEDTGCTISRKVNWYSHDRKQYEVSSKN